MLNIGVWNTNILTKGSSIFDTQTSYQPFQVGNQFDKAFDNSSGTSFMFVNQQRVNQTFPEGETRNDL